MKADAYSFAIGEGRKPAPLKLLESIDRFGVKAVTGRDVLSYGEISRMRYCELIVSLYKSREAASNWAEWTGKNKAAAQALNEAERLYNVE